MAHLVCKEHGKRVCYGYTKNDEFVVWHRNTGGSTAKQCDGSTFKTGECTYHRWNLGPLKI